jgi:hypothetical protein
MASAKRFFGVGRFTKRNKSEIDLLHYELHDNSAQNANMPRSSSLPLDEDYEDDDIELVVTQETKTSSESSASTELVRDRTSIRSHTPCNLVTKPAEGFVTKLDGI